MAGLRATGDVSVEIGDRNRCDFCSAENPPWEFPARTYQVGAFPMHGMTVNSVDDWRACDKCHRLITSNDWDGLARHAREAIQIDVPLEVFQSVHQEFRKNWIGPPKRRTD